MFILLYRVCFRTPVEHFGKLLRYLQRKNLRERNPVMPKATQLFLFSQSIYPGLARLTTVGGDDNNEVGHPPAGNVTVPRATVDYRGHQLEFLARKL